MRIVANREPQQTPVVNLLPAPVHVEPAVVENHVHVAPALSSPPEVVVNCPGVVVPDRIHLSDESIASLAEAIVQASARKPVAFKLITDSAGNKKIVPEPLE